MSEAIDASQQKATVTAHQINISVAQQLANLVKSTLGPYGMDKEMVDAAGKVVMTNDGATILKETNLKHPTATIITEIARTQEENCYDGTTSSVVINGELMKKASLLLDKNIHPTRIAKGYNLANNKAQDLLEEIDKIISESKSAIFLWIHLPHVLLGYNGYGSDIQLFDEFVGHVVDKFKDQEIYLTSDHGHMNLERGIPCYGSHVYQGNIKIPFITNKFFGSIIFAFIKYFSFIIFFYKKFLNKPFLPQHQVRLAPLLDFCLYRQLNLYLFRLLYS